RRPPDQAEASGIEIVPDRTVTENIGRRQGERHHLLAIVDQVVEALPQLLAIEIRTDDGLHRIDLRTVPVDVEDARKLWHDGAHDDGIHVDEVLGGAAHEILVGDVAPARDEYFMRSASENFVDMDAVEVL